MVNNCVIFRTELDVISQYGGQSVSALGWGFSENDSLFSKEHVCVLWI